MTPPDFSGLASRSVILIRSALGLNKGFPPPKTRGARAKSISSNNPRAKSVAERFALPKTKRSLPGCCFSLATSSSGFSFTSLVLFHSAFLSVLEKTIFGIVFMKSATSPFWDGQYPAIPSYVTRPNNSIPVDFECSIEYFSSSSPQTVSCQSMSQLFGPSKKPSSVTRFHMISFLISIHRPRLSSIPREVNRPPHKYPLSRPFDGLRTDPQGPAWASADRFIRHLPALRPNPGRVSPVRRGPEPARFEAGAQSRLRVRRARRLRRTRIGNRACQAEDRRRWRRSTPSIGPAGSRGAGRAESDPQRGPPPPAWSPRGLRWPGPGSRCSPRAPPPWCQARCRNSRPRPPAAPGGPARGGPTPRRRRALVSCRADSSAPRTPN